MALSKSNSDILKITDVTAVKFYNADLILIGIGNTLYLYKISTDSITDRLGVLIGQKIYGIVTSKECSEVIVYGGKQLRTITINDTENTIRLLDICNFECKDWIQVACWSSSDEISILTSHNYVFVLDLKTNGSQSHPPDEICILYCGHLYRLPETILVFAGTVFSQVLIYTLKEKRPIHVLKGHQGVIFSIDWNAERRIIITTSDDRSVRLWAVEPRMTSTPDLLSFWENSSITCRYTLFGHTARVWRGLFTRDAVVTIGEDSKICIWNFEGDLVKKVKAHQGGCIWASDYCPELNRIVTGGGDGGVTLHPVSLLNHSDDRNEISCINNPKKVSLSQTGNIICVTDDSNIIYFNTTLSKKSIIFEGGTQTRFSILAASVNKKYFAFADLSGNVTIYAENNSILDYISKTEINDKILSLHWSGNTQLISCSNSGDITVWDIKTKKGIDKFILPPCKERWLTAIAAIDKTHLFGDRCGSLHLYKQGNPEPLHSQNKTHGHLGINAIEYTDDKVLTAGRDGYVKYYELRNDKLQYLYQTKATFDWIERFLIDSNLICGFRESSLIVYDNSSNAEIVELNCGGGHRSWDIKCNETDIKISYIKNGKIKLYNFKKTDVISRTIFKGTHTKEINDLKIVEIELSGRILIISGGEDTTLRISISDVISVNSFKELLILRHLSNIRSISVTMLKENQYLIVTAGGRAEISIKILKIIHKNNDINVAINDVTGFLLKGSDKERKGNKNWRNSEVDFDPETRFMSVETVISKEKTTVYAGCSDSYFRIFEFKNESLECIATMKFHKRCILKVKYFQLNDSGFILTMGTDGIVAFWKADMKHSNPVDSFKIQKSGINDCDIRIIGSDLIALASGGDDNSVNLNVFKVDSRIELKSNLNRESWHCSQVTGVRFFGENKLLSASIDQRITVINWGFENDSNTLKMDYIKQIYSDVADIQGLNVFSNNLLCVYGKGINVINYNIL